MKNALGQSDFKILKRGIYFRHISLEQLGQSAWFLHADIDWRWVKGDLKVFSWEDSNVLDQSDCRIARTTISQENGVNQPDSLLVDIDSRKANVFKGWP